jgi:ABC-type transporter Mla subunit MlaD
MNTDRNSSSSSELKSAGLSSSLATDSIDDLNKIANEIHNIADRDRTDPVALLQLLRTLEHLHREIQQDYFQAALPNSRQALYTLLRDIEENGGWPYIQRWKLQALFANLSETEK